MHYNCDTFWPRALSVLYLSLVIILPSFHVLLENPVNSHHLLQSTDWTIVGQLSGSRQAVVRQSSGSRQAVVRQSSGTQKALVRAVVSRHQAFVNLLSDFYFELQLAAYETEDLFSLDLSWRPAKTFFHSTEIWQLEDILFLEEYQYKWAYIQYWKVS